MHQQTLWEDTTDTRRALLCSVSPPISQPINDTHLSPPFQHLFLDPPAQPILPGLVLGEIDESVLSKELAVPRLCEFVFPRGTRIASSGTVPTPSCSSAAAALLVPDELVVLLEDGQLRERRGTMGRVGWVVTDEMAWLG